MRKILEIAWLYLKTTYSEKSTLFFGFLLPILFTYIIGLGISGFEPDEGPVAWPIRIVNSDSGQLADQFIELLQSDASLDVSLSDLAGAQDALAEASTSAILVIPGDFSAELQNGKPQSLDFYLNLDDPVSAQVVEQALLVAMGKLGASLDIADSSLGVATRLGLFDLAEQGAPSEKEYRADSLEKAIAAWSSELPAVVRASKVTLRDDVEVDIPNGFQQTSPGMAVIFAMFFIVGGSGTVLLEREQGTLRRLMVTPTGKSSIMAGKLLGIFLAGLFQFSILIIAGQFFFGVDWGASPLALVIMVLAFCFMVTSLGILVASLVRSYAQLDAISTILIMTLSGLGGAMWPIEIVPDFMQRLQMYVPTGWAMHGFHDIVTRGLDVNGIALEAAVLMGFGIVFLALGIRVFRYE